MQELVEVGRNRELLTGSEHAAFGLRGPGGQDPVTAGGRGIDAGQPQSRLADSGLARQHGGARKLLGGVEILDDCSELRFPADKLPRRYGHVSHHSAPTDERPR